MREDARVGKRPNLSVQVLEIVRNALKEDQQLCAGAFLPSESATRFLGSNPRMTQ